MTTLESNTREIITADDVKDYADLYGVSGLLDKLPEILINLINRVEELESKEKN